MNVVGGASHNVADTLAAVEFWLLPNRLAYNSSQGVALDAGRDELDRIVAEEAGCALANGQADRIAPGRVTRRASMQAEISGRKIGQ